MKRIFLSTIITAALLFSGCDSWLERQPDDAMSTEIVFQKYSTTLQYLTGVYTYVSNESDQSGQTNPWTGASDEGSIAYVGRTYTTINRNTWTPNSNTNMGNLYQNYWYGIREATFFMQHVHECPELTDLQKDEWYAEARFLRAFYYYMMMKVYGPVFILHEDLVDFSDRGIRDRDRDTWDYCVEWVANELDECAKVLPEIQPKNEWYGRATKGAALGVKAKLMLYNARPLFNYGDDGRWQGSVTRPDGVKLFPQSYDANKWQLAADAAKAVMDMGIYILMGEDSGDPYNSIKSVYLERCNDELIWTTERSGGSIRYCIVPSGMSGTAYGGIGPTQKMVDAFAMDNGTYPITGYNADGSPIIDQQSGYDESFFSSFTHPMYSYTVANTWSAYLNREPRFYINVFWSGLTWRYNSSTSYANVQFFKNGNSGYMTSNNYTPTGYLMHKWHDPALNTTGGSWGQISWPYIRFADILLMRAEALNEINPNDQEILTCLNRVRKRAGVPDIETVYPNAFGDKDAMRDLIIRERMIELCAENNRFFDTRTLMISDTEDDGNFYGMNIDATDHDPYGDFWQRVIIVNEGGYRGIRTWEPKKYLFPFPQGEIDRTDFTQNYGW